MLKNLRVGGGGGGGGGGGAKIRHGRADINKFLSIFRGFPRSAILFPHLPDVKTF